MLHGISFAEFLATGYVRVENPATRKIEPFHAYPLQAQFLRDVFDTLDPETGLRRFRRAVFSVPKKSGKTTLASLCALHHLLFDPFEHDREVYSIAGDLDQALIVLEQAKKIIKRSPQLRALFGKGADYQRELVLDDRETGEVHRFRPLSSDSPTSHGLNPSLVIVDEGWQFRNYELLEAVALGPQRRCPLQLWVTYAGLKAQMVDGNPLYDLYRAGLAGTDPTLYFMWRSGLEAYDDLPPGFIRAGYLDEQRRALPSNRFNRLHLNQWGEQDVGFLTGEEIAAATVKTPAPDRSARPHVLAIDYGRSKDHTALMAAARDEFNNILVSAALTLKGSPEHPVPLDVVEDAIVDHVERFNVQRVIVDPWQMIGSAERLSKRLQWPLFDTATADAKPTAKAIVLRPIGAAYLNRLTQGLLGTFRSKTIQIPSVLVELLDQLGAVIVKDTFYGTRIDSGSGAGVRGHDDLVIVLGMVALELTARGSLLEMPAYTCRINNSVWLNCVIVDHCQGHEYWRDRAQCRDCGGMQFVRAAWSQAELRAQEHIELRTFLKSRVRDNQPAALAGAVADRFYEALSSGRLGR